MAKMPSFTRNEEAVGRMRAGIGLKFDDPVGPEKLPPEVAARLRGLERRIILSRSAYLRQSRSARGKRR